MTSRDAQSQTVEMTLRLARQHHEAGRLSQAEHHYLDVLRAEPGHPDANHGLGTALVQRGAAAQGLPYLETAVGALPDDSRYWPSYASALIASGRANEALAMLEKGRQRGLSGPIFDSLLSAAQTQTLARAAEADELYAAALQQHRLGQTGLALGLYRRALAITPDRLETQVNFANALASQGQCGEAAAAYRRAIAIEPKSAEVHNNLGAILSQAGKQDEALAAYRRALELQPDYADALYNLGNLLEQLGRATEAIASYRQALAINPDLAKAHHNLGTALCGAGDIDAGFVSFTRHAELDFEAARTRFAGVAPAHKTRHDQEQRDYLSGETGSDVGPVANLLHLADGSRLQTPAVNPANSADVAEKWRSSRPQIVVIDNFLTEPALEKLRRFCWGSTVWRRVYDDGYLGAMPEYGFACPLLAQIANELRQIFPDVIATHPLRYLWGFKYDSQQSGIRIHADKAAVNVNFWITPDEANHDPASGGLVVWDVAAPLDWKPAKYNGDVAASRDFLARAGARPITIPYRANRAVIFDSDLFHETDNFAFRDGYQNRRLNITLLYGDRGSHE